MILDKSSAAGMSATPLGVRRAAVVFIFVTVALDILALGVMIPVLPKLVLGFQGGDSAGAASWYGGFAAAFAAMQFLCSPLLGALSDRFGRRPVILLSNLGLGLDYIVMALAPNLWVLFAGRVFAGVTSASISTANAYIADVTPAENRAAAFGMLGAAFGLGFVIGPALGGLLGSIDQRLPFWVAAGLSLLNFAYGWFILPESLPPARRAPFAWRGASPLGAVRFLRAHAGVAPLAAIGFLSQLAHMSLPAIFVLYADYRYGWSEWQVGIALAAVGVSSALVQGGLVRRLVPRFGEVRMLRVGLLAGALGFLLYGFAPSAAWIWLAIPVMAIWGFATPSMQGLLSGRVAASEQGRLQGALTSVNGMAGIFGPFLFTQLFAEAIRYPQAWHMPGVAFYLAAILLALALLLAFRHAR